MTIAVTNLPGNLSSVEKTAHNLSNNLSRAQINRVNRKDKAELAKGMRSGVKGLQQHTEIYLDSLKEEGEVHPALLTRGEVIKKVTQFSLDKAKTGTDAEAIGALHAAINIVNEVATGSLTGALGKMAYEGLKQQQYGFFAAIKGEDGKPVTPDKELDRLDTERQKGYQEAAIAGLRVIAEAVGEKAAVKMLDEMEPDWALAAIAHTYNKK